MKHKRRFSDEQIRSLEYIFENESKLEPRKKMQLATELGLHPRQVAIWFQNKRARFKSKRLEREYSTLRANYNALASRFEILKNEKQDLILQLEKLKELVDKTRTETQCSDARNSSDSQSDTYRSDQHKNNSKECECEEQHLLSMEGSDDGCCENTSYFVMEEETHLLTSILATPRNLDTLFSQDLYDPSATSFEWCDIWS